MTSQENFNYLRISEAINYIRQNYKAQPNLEEVAEKLNLSPYHFQRLFTDWVGVSLKKFLQYISLQYAKSILREKSITLFDAAYETGLSGTGRLHDLFMTMEGMTPGEYKNGGENLTLNYSFADSPFGRILVASTSKGICNMAFIENEEHGLLDIKKQFPHARYHLASDTFQENALAIFTGNWNELNQIKVHLKGTEFQLKVWETLLKIPLGGLVSYANIAEKMGNSKASRAVGTAISKNPIAYLIPCHRVIQSTGNIGEYMWGNARKTAIIGWEGVKTELVL